MLSTFVGNPLTGSVSELAETAFNALYLALSVSQDTLHILRQLPLPFVTDSHNILLQGMYPTIVVILVHYKSSTEETYGISALVASGENAISVVEDRPATVGHLSFAVPQPTTGPADTEALDGPVNTSERDKSRFEDHENGGTSTQV